MPAGDRAKPGDVVPVRRGPYGCGPGGLHYVIEPEIGERASCDCGSVMRYVARDRYCAPLRCYCGGCPSYRAPEPINYRQVVARMQREKADKEQRAEAARKRLAAKKPR
jgi:hypothetical protein